MQELPRIHERHPHWTWGIALGALGLRLAVSTRDLVALDRLFVPDDTYYLLAIARNIANGLGPSADGTVLTSGFQPLLTFLMVPVFRLTASVDVPIRSLMALLCVIDALNVVLIGRIAGSLAPRRVAGTFAALFWAASPYAIALSLTGLETSLAILGLLAVLWRWIECLRRPTPWRAGLLGIVTGLALLARVDSAFVVGLMGTWQLCRGDRRMLAIVVPVAVLVVAPWWGYCLLQFGSVVPESGAAARELATAYQGGGVYVAAWVWGTGFVLGPPLVHSQALRYLLFTVWPLGLASVAVFWAGYLRAASWLSKSAPAALRGPAVVLGATGAALFVFYAGVVPVIWFFNRYLSATVVVVTLLASALLAEAHRRWRVVTLTLVGTSVMIGLAQSARFVTADASIEREWAIDSPTGYRAPMVTALGQLPDGAVVGSLQSGALSYFASRGIRVVNLDGVVDHEAALAFRERRLNRLVRDRGVTYFVDWPLQHDLLRSRSDAPIQLDVIWRAGSIQKSGHAVQISRVTFPSR